MPRLSLDGLRRIQQTLTRRVVQRDPKNIRAVGFAPFDAESAPAGLDADATLPVVAQFDVWQKRSRVPEAKRITPRESLRLLDRSTGRYDEIALATDVRQSGDVVATGVEVRGLGSQAVAAVVVRWTDAQPVPPVPSNADDAQALPWRWGVLTVSHLFAAAGQGGAGQAARLQRKVVCGDGPRAVSGRVVARGRIPGGPDVALVETGLDRLWLSGFLPRVGLDEIAVASESDLLRWTAKGTTGQLFADRRSIAWDWQTYYPSLFIAGLGRLQHIIRYGVANSAGDGQPPTALGPGTSGGVLVAGGIPVGMQVAAMQPGYIIGYAQSFTASVAWLQDRLQATAFVIVRVVT